MIRMFMVLVIFYYTTKVAHNIKYEVLLENMAQCENPLPPYPSKRTMQVEFKLSRSKGKTLLSGRNTVLAEIPFLNFSLSSYSVDKSGNKKLEFHIDKASCRNFFGKTFLIFGDFQYNKSNCVLLRGSSSYKDLDIDKMFRKMPMQHSAGTMLHRISLVSDGHTALCVETLVTVKTV